MADRNGQFGTEDGPDPEEAGENAWHGNRKRILEKFDLDGEDDE